MRIAILAPSPSPFALGGAESLWSSLQRFINDETVHAAEVFKLSINENTFTGLLDAYAAFAEFNAKDFDALITGKYPAWMATHHNHRIYMLHTLRGLYDTYHLTGMPTKIIWPVELAKTEKKMTDLLQHSPASGADIRRFIDDIKTFLSNNPQSSLHAFPGPFSRDVIHRLDRMGTDTRKISGYTAISQTVANRENYFPAAAQVGVVHHPPSTLDKLHCQGDEFLFTASRLDGAKRIHLLIEAMKHVKADIPLLIAGVGPEEERLREMAADDARIVFLGRLTEAELVQHYANALAVPFVPYDEDYGLITIEAMKSSKPVITTHDAGGVNEFVRNGETGFSTAPDPLAIAQAINRVAENRSETQQMGRNAAKAVASINWKRVAEQVLGVELGKKISVQMPATKKQKIVVATTFPVFPPRGGGQARIYHLYRALAEQYDIELVTLSAVGDTARLQLSPGFHETRIGKSASHQLAEDKWSHGVGGLPITDIVAAELIDATPLYIEQLKIACAEAHIVVASHPYLAQILHETAPQAELWLEIHNVEAALKASILPPSKNASVLIEKVRAIEGYAWRNAQVVMSCTQQDLDDMSQLYGETKSFKILVPNGFSPEEVAYSPEPIKAKVKQGLALNNKPTALFMGSWHGPNLEAIQFLIALAPALPDVIFLIAGSGGLKFADNAVPDNVILLGVLDEEEKQVILSAADIALNPMVSGSGSNLKMLDYLAAGLPIVSTPFGARGLDDDLLTCIRLAEIEQFGAAIFEHFVEVSDADKETRRQVGRFIAHERYAWPEIARQTIKILDGACRPTERAGLMK